LESTLMATSRAIRRAYDLRLAPLGLNLSEASLLAFVRERGPMSQSQIAERIGMGRAAAGAVVDGLSARGLLERRLHPRDRRVWLVAVTEEAAPVVLQVEMIDKSLRDELREGIDREERQRLARTLVRLKANLASVLEEGGRSVD
jgi:MarR family transcriptional regulator for hemolysin